MATIIKYTTAPADGPESTVEYERYEDAATVAQRDGLQVIEKRYEFADSELVDDFTRYHWLLTARCEGDDETDLYRPDGPDLCFETPAEAMDNLVERLTLALREGDGCEADPCDGKAHCGQCDPCRGYDSVYASVRALADVDSAEIDEHGYTCTVAPDPEVPVAYRITRILSTQCDENNHT